MKTNNTHISNQAADFVVDRDILGQTKNMRMSILRKLKYKSHNAPELKVSYAGLGRRILAALVDLTIVLILMSIMEMILFPSNIIDSNYRWYSILLGILIWIFYNGIFGSSIFQATIGEMLLRIKLIDLFGKPLSFSKASLRSVTLIVSILPFGLGIWYMTTDPKKQSWHDLIAGSYVINE
jgi:uncharacterized RDD family membrane protein YckC